MTEVVQIECLYCRSAVHLALEVIALLKLPVKFGIHNI